MEGAEAVPFALTSSSKKESNFGCHSTPKFGQKSRIKSYLYRNVILTRIHQFSLLVNLEAMKMLSKLGRGSSEHFLGSPCHLLEFLSPSELEPEC